MSVSPDDDQVRGLGRSDERIGSVVVLDVDLHRNAWVLLSPAGQDLCDYP
jgi:hypothetical protein